MHNWFLRFVLADYAEWQDRVDSESRQNPRPFKAWFPEGDRVYIPFMAQEQEFDQDVADALAEVGCQITDYRGGYCQCGKRTFRIGKAIEQARRQALQQIQQNPDQFYDPQREAAEINRVYDEVAETFAQSPLRVGGKQSGPQYYVVISQDPHDIAQMSTDRGWTSCMQLGEGSYYEDVFCEVREGGLIAYLVYAHDQEIRNPLARILIRRFDNRAGQSVAIQEGSIYGNDMPGFEETVRNWLTQHQGDVQPGMYRRKGGEYSDSFGATMLVAPTRAEDVLKWYRGEGEDAQYSWFEVEDNSPGEDYEDETPKKVKFDTREEAEEYARQMNEYDDDYWREAFGEPYTDIDEETGEYEHQRYEVREHARDHRTDMKNQASREILQAPKGTYPDETIKEIKTDIFDGRSTSPRKARLRELFAEKYPELMTDEEWWQLGQREYFKHIVEMPEGPEKDQIKQEILQDISGWLDNMSIEGWAEKSPQVAERLREYKNVPGNMVEKGNFLESLGLHMNVVFNEEITRPLIELFKPVPEPIAQKLVEAAGKIVQLELGDPRKAVIPRRGDHRIKMLREIVHIFHITGTDTPTVQKFYEWCLQYFGDNHIVGGILNDEATTKSEIDQWSDLNIDTLGLSIARLGPQNGRQFLPWAQRKLAEEQEFEQQLLALEQRLNAELLEYEQIRESGDQAQIKEIDEAQRRASYRASMAEGARLNWVKKNIEKWHYIIDMLTYGKPQKKYKLSSRNWLQRSFK